MQTPPTTVDDLGLQGCLFLWALVTAQNRRLPVAPTKRMSVAVMHLLQQQGVIEVPWPAPRWPVGPEAQETPLEGLQWRLCWTVYDPAQLTAALEDYLCAVDRDDWAMAIRLRLWSEIAVAEAEQFFEQQLTKHQFPGEWSQDIAFAYRDGRSQLNLSQWRYCAWAAVRRGASLAIQLGARPEEIRGVIYRELGQRAVSVGSGLWTRCALPPFHPTPGSALARGFIRLLAPLGDDYWNAIPNVETLSRHHVR